MMENTDIRGDDRIGDHFLMIFLDVSDSAADAGRIAIPIPAFAHAVPVRESWLIHK